MADAGNSIVLNANQRRHFDVLFARLEHSLDNVERLLDTPDERPRVLTTVHDDVPPSFRAHARPLIADLRRQIVDLAAALSLEPRTVSTARVIGASLSAEAIRLEDSLSPQLRGYGIVHQSIPEKLDPVLQAMAYTLNQLAATLHRQYRAMRSP